MKDILPAKEVLAMSPKQREIYFAKQRVIVSRSTVKFWLDAVKKWNKTANRRLEMLEMWKDPTACHIPGWMLRDASKQILTADFTEAHVKSQVDKYKAGWHYALSRREIAKGNLSKALSEKSEAIRKLRGLTTPAE